MMRTTDFAVLPTCGQENCKVLVPTLRVGTDHVGRSASVGVELALLQQVASPMDAERPERRYDAERRNEGEIATSQFSRLAAGVIDNPRRRGLC